MKEESQLAFSIQTTVKRDEHNIPVIIMWEKQGTREQLLLIPIRKLIHHIMPKHVSVQLKCTYAHVHDVCILVHDFLSHVESCSCSQPNLGAREKKTPYTSTSKLVSSIWMLISFFYTWMSFYSIYSCMCSKCQIRCHAL